MWPSTICEKSNICENAKELQQSCERARHMDRHILHNLYNLHILHKYHFYIIYKINNWRSFHILHICKRYYSIFHSFLIRLYIDILAWLWLSPYSLSHSLSQSRSQSPVENPLFEGQRLRRHRLTAKGFAKGFAKGLAKGLAKGCSFEGLCKI